jgi:hypothetical protein
MLEIGNKGVQRIFSCSDGMVQSLQVLEEDDTTNIIRVGTAHMMQHAIRASRGDERDAKVLGAARLGWLG